MVDTILKSKHVHLAGTATIEVVADLLKDTNYTVYTNKESVLELRNRMPKVNVVEYKIPFQDDAKGGKLVCLPVSEMDTAILTHSLFEEGTKCWTFQKDWKKGNNILGKHLTDKEHVVVHCNKGSTAGIRTYRARC